MQKHEYLVDIDVKTKYEKRNTKNETFIQEINIQLPL